MTDVTRTVAQVLTSLEADRDTLRTVAAALEAAIAAGGGSGGGTVAATIYNTDEASTKLTSEVQGFAAIMQAVDNDLRDKEGLARRNGFYTSTAVAAALVSYAARITVLQAVVDSGGSGGGTPTPTPTPSPSFSITQASVTHSEGAAGSITDYVFTVAVDRQGSTAAFPFTWGAAGSGTVAAQAADLVATSGSVTVASGTNAANITVQVKGNDVVTATREFTLTVDGGSALGSKTAKGIITEDDIAPQATYRSLRVESDSWGGDLIEMMAEGPFPFASPSLAARVGQVVSSFSPLANINNDEGAAIGPASNAADGDFTTRYDRRPSVKAVSHLGHNYSAGMRAPWVSFAPAQGRGPAGNFTIRVTTDPIDPANPPAPGSGIEVFRNWGLPNTFFPDAQIVDEPAHFLPLDFTRLDGKTDASAATYTWVGITVYTATINDTPTMREIGIWAGSRLIGRLEIHSIPATNQNGPAVLIDGGSDVATWHTGALAGFGTAAGAGYPHFFAVRFAADVPDRVSFTAMSQNAPKEVLIRTGNSIGEVTPTGLGPVRLSRAQSAAIPRTYAEGASAPFFTEYFVFQPQS